MRVGLVGLGFMGSMHARVLGPRLAAVCSGDPRKRAGDLSAVGGNLEGAGGTLDFSGVKPYAALAEMLQDPEIDAVDLCVPTDLHEAATIQALRAGKHVLVEKPMALDGESARRMIAAAQACGKVLMTAQVLRFFPEYRALRAALPELGPPKRAWFHRRCAAPAWGGWLKDPSRSGGGVFDLLIHDADVCLHLFGPPVAVTAAGTGDAMEAQLFYGDGLVATVTGGWEVSPEYPFRMEYRVSGERGLVEYSSLGRPPVRYAAEAKTLPLDPADGYAAEIDYFLACCESGRQPELCPAAESAQAVDLMRLLLAAQERNGEKLPCSL